MKFLTFICLSTILATTAVQAFIQCDFMTQKECFVNETAISDADTAFQDENIEIGLLSISGPNVNFLPVKVAEKFQNLENFLIENGNFERIGRENFEKLFKLTDLAIRNAKSLKVVEKDSFSDLERLISLAIEGSRIEYFHSETFKELKNLQRLILSHNKLSMLHPTAFDSLNLLVDVSIASNRLKTLDGRLFRNKSGLKKIDGRNNKLVYLDESTFDGLEVEELNLSGETGTDCVLYSYKGSNGRFVDVDEVRQDIRDNCKGSDFQVHQVHAEMMEIAGKFGDKI